MAVLVAANEIQSLVSHRSERKNACAFLSPRRRLSYRLIGRNLGLFKNTVMEIVKREDG